jgi:hypothetical protein
LPDHVDFALRSLNASHGFLLKRVDYPDLVGNLHAIDHPERIAPEWQSIHLSLEGVDLQKKRFLSLFRMRDDVHDQIPVTLDEEVKAPILVDACLPEAPALVVFLGTERWMVEILEQQQRLLVEGALDLLGCLG